MAENLGMYHKFMANICIFITLPDTIFYLRVSSEGRQLPIVLFLPILNKKVLLTPCNFSLVSAKNGKVYTIEVLVNFL